MTVFVPAPFASRTWALPLPAPDLRGSRRLRRAVCDRTVLVTGASSGIGEATARRLGSAGAHVLLVARSEDRLRELAGEIGDAHVHAADLSEPEDVDRLVAEVLDVHGGVDILVNNAGHSIRRSVELSESRPHDYERTMALNYFGALRLILGVLPSMRERGRGHIINVSSMGVQMGAPRFSAYVASKSALDAFTRVLGGEARADGIATTTVHMPLVRTPMIAPTKAYRNAPALSADAAADMVCEAVRSRPARVDLPLGTIGEVAGVLTPGLVTRAMSLAFRAARD